MPRLAQLPKTVACTTRSSLASTSLDDGWYCQASASVSSSPRKSFRVSASLSELRLDLSTRRPASSPASVQASLLALPSSWVLAYRKKIAEKHKAQNLAEKIRFTTRRNKAGLDIDAAKEADDVLRRTWRSKLKRWSCVTLAMRPALVPNLKTTDETK